MKRTRAWAAVVGPIAMILHTDTMQNFAHGHNAEHGGELIDQGHTTIRHLAQELGLPLDNLLAAEPNGSTIFPHFDGVAYLYRDVVRDLKRIWRPLHRDLIQAGFPYAL